LKGGKSAYSGEISIKRAKTNKIETYSKVTGLKLNKDDLLFFRTGGGGGFGDPLQRPADKVAEDVQLGFISVDSAKKNYGVDVNAKTLRVNASTTLALRQKMKSKSKGK
jgi:N-methylhydantoinase B